MIIKFLLQRYICSYLLFAVVGMICSEALARTDFLPEAYKQIINQAVLRNAVDRPTLIKTIEWVGYLAKSTQDPEVIGELARLECANAEVEQVKNKRVRLYEGCIEVADKALAIHANEVSALYWKAVAMGNLTEENGILDALHYLRTMEWLFLRVVILDEKYDYAGAHNALGRLYHQLPGFPISFGSYKKALFHIKRAYALFPNDIITRAFYAELLFDMGKKQEAYAHARFILSTPIKIENRFRLDRFIGIARNILKRAGA